jgi:hypothetical protein
MCKLYVAIALLMLTTSARADWQYTRWGMTPDDVVAASNGKARRAEPGLGREGEILPPGSGRLAEAETKISGVRFYIQFLFRKERLVMVQLSGLCSQSASQEIENQLRLEYGEPTNTGVTTLYRRFYWPRAGVDLIPGRWPRCRGSPPPAQHQGCIVRYDCEEPECYRNFPTGLNEGGRTNVPRDSTGAPVCDD